MLFMGGVLLEATAMFDSASTANWARSLGRRYPSRFPKADSPNDVETRAIANAARAVELQRQQGPPAPGPEAAAFIVSAYLRATGQDVVEPERKATRWYDLSGAQLDPRGVAAQILDANERRLGRA
jgi:hypothetical protein